MEIHTYTNQFQERHTFVIYYCCVKEYFLVEFNIVSYFSNCRLVFYHRGRMESTTNECIPKKSF
jgi:hypothetical protein